ncbi:MAG: hypothetical protein IRZ18_04730 [Clostridia bacterium]|nr:hypothetical protein [Clostridia bacterium]
MRWYAFVGCILIGTGLGVLTGHAGAGSLIGVGAGFLVVAVLSRHD